MTKADLVEAVYAQMPCSKKEATSWVERLFVVIKAALARGENVRITGFGHFTVRQKRPRVGRNPQTGEVIEITGRTVLTFQPSQILKARLNCS